MSQPTHRTFLKCTRPILVGRNETEYARPVLKVKLLNEGARIPTKAHEGDAGYDLYASEDTILYKSAVVSTGVAVSIPRGYYGRVASRSGLSFKENVEVGAGVVDSNFTSEILVHLYRHGPYIDLDSFYQLDIKKGDRIAQLIITPYASPEILVVGALDETERGEKGFGSSGK